MARDTIAAISTPPGTGGIGIIRLSGPSANSIISALTGHCPLPRVAHYTRFTDHDGSTIDHGLVLYFRAPASFTGEDIAELHAHGSNAVLDMLLARVHALGARLARPGEFTERAFRNGKIDLAQAEAVADLIASRSARAARSSMRSLEGEFSRRVQAIADSLTHMRAMLEASIDFSDEALSVSLTIEPLLQLRLDLARLLSAARHGARLCSGAKLVIIGAPNVGKSTLLNRLAGSDRAIVSAQPGTTRDIIDVDINLDGMPIRISDTAGLRQSSDDIEQEGIRRAQGALELADLVLLVIADPERHSLAERLHGIGAEAAAAKPIVVVHNKIDLFGGSVRRERDGDVRHVHLAARADLGIDLLREAIVEMLAGEEQIDDEFSARARHVAALEEAVHLLSPIDAEMIDRNPEIVAEIYRRAALCVGEICGTFTTEDLLGEIFSRFCIGK